MKKVGILMGSASDMPVVKKALDTLASFDIPYEVHVYSAHRTPVEAAEFTKNAKANGFDLVLDIASNPTILYYTPSADRTEQIINQLK